MTSIKVKSIKHLVELAITVVTNEHFKFSLGKVSTEIANIVKQVTGMDISGYDCIIDNFAVKHTLLQHGNAAKEEKHGQIPVTIDYFEKIPDVIKNPDCISDGGLSKIGRRIIVYAKRVNGVIIYVEEIRTKKKELAMLTMYMKKAR